MTTILVILIIAVAVWWWIWLNPYSFNFSETTLEIDQEAEHRVFAFGTLTNPLVRTIVIRAYVPTEPAELEGYRRYRLDLLPEDDAVTEGRFFFTLTPPNCVVSTVTNGLACVTNAICITSLMVNQLGFIDASVRLIRPSMQLTWSN